MIEVLSDQNEKNIERAANYIKAGKVIGFATETVYGLGASIYNEKAIDEIYRLKNRTLTKALIVHLGKISDVLKVAIDIPDDFYILAKFFFPGPLSVILKKRNDIAKNISLNDTVAVRMPNFPTTLKMINLIGFPIVGTSANISNEKNPISAQDVLNSFNNKIDLILDGGECLLKLPSTIIDLTQIPYKILRYGKISKEEIEEVLQKKIFT
ncbi:MAG: threonylcarbamoyl-AMP synthase [Parachlamydiales bacterium]|nr:threonylcarbamoyl-AMP synthase [Parachlamydiales bacterium]